MERDNPWSRRAASKSSFSKTENQPRGFGPSKRYVSTDSSTLSRANGSTPLSASTVASPNASKAFGLGSGAFAAFGFTTTSTGAKAPKTPGSTFDVSKSSSGINAAQLDTEQASIGTGKPLSKSASKEQVSAGLDAKEWPLKYTWVTWYRPPAVSKSQDYEKSIKPVCKMASAQEFWKAYAHLRSPSALPVVSDYHFFKEGIRPVWEDEANKRGGKWIIRFKKGVMDRYWDELLLATIGDQFSEASEEVCGMVVSVRNGEDVLSVWTRDDGGRNVKIRETIKRLLNLPADTIIVWKSHDDSIAQKTAVEQARHDKGEKRRNTLNDSANDGKDKEREKQGVS